MRTFILFYLVFFMGSIFSQAEVTEVETTSPIVTDQPMEFKATSSTVTGREEEEGTSTAIMTDEEVAQVARERSYPGGADEEALRVQDPLPVPYKKLDIKRIQEQVYKELRNKPSKNDSPNGAGSSNGNSSSDSSDS